MKEALFILLVIGFLLALTAIRYRRQITGAIGVARMLRDAARGGTGSSIPARQPQESIPLVHCETCGVWVPKNKAIGTAGRAYCSKQCIP